MVPGYGPFIGDPHILGVVAWSLSLGLTWETLIICPSPTHKTQNPILQNPFKEVRGQNPGPCSSVRHYTDKGLGGLGFGDPCADPNQGLYWGGGNLAYIR